jgi:hypothetical protein
MEIEPTYGYDSLVRQATGSKGEGGDYKVILYIFDIYEIKVKLSLTNEFLGILEVKVNKDFLSQKQRIGTQSYLDVDKYYRE